jgi:hypothetical protein
MASFIAQSGPQICCKNDVFAQISKPVTALMHQKRGAREHEELAAAAVPSASPHPHQGALGAEEEKKSDAPTYLLFFEIF